MTFISPFATTFLQWKGDEFNFVEGINLIKKLHFIIIPTYRQKKPKPKSSYSIPKTKLQFEKSFNILFKAANFSHRIDNFSFGDNSHLVHNALNCDLKTTNSGKKKQVQLILNNFSF